MILSSLHKANLKDKSTTAEHIEASVAKNEKHYYVIFNSGMIGHTREERIFHTLCKSPEEIVYKGTNAKEVEEKRHGLLREKNTSDKIFK